MRFALLLVLLGGAALAHPHESPSLWVDLEIRETEVLLVVSSEVSSLGAWGLEPGSLVEPMEEAARAGVLARAAEHFATRNTVAIDGARALPTGRGLRMPQDDKGIDLYGYLSFTFAYACERKARTVTLHWEDFGWALWQERVVVPGLVKVHPRVDMFGVTPEEPEYTWHAPVEGRAPPLDGSRQLPRQEGTRVPMASVALAMVAILAVALPRRRPLGTRLAGAAVLLAAAFLVRDRAVYAWRPSVDRPSQAQAAEIFRTLQANLYAAFEAPTEEGIYELLAASVEPQALDPIYIEICEGLILRQQGGPVATIERVEPVETLVEFPSPEAPLFEARWRWRLHCVVSHFGHVHRRINEYEALFRVAHDGDGWRIRGFEVLDRKRTDLD